MTKTESKWRAVAELPTPDLVWAESPRWRDGELWVSDTQGSQLVIAAKENTRVHKLETPVNGTGFLPSGDLVAARMHDARLDRFDGEGWALYRDLGELVAGRLGDLVVLSDGTVLVDDVKPNDPGRLLRVPPDGLPSVAADDLAFPNGLAVIDDGGTLVVAETHAGRLTAFTFGSRGELHSRRLIVDLRAELGPESLPDGIWPSGDGSLWVAVTRGEAVVRVQHGHVVERVAVDGFAIACCLNDDETELYVTVAKSLDLGTAVIDAVYKKRTRARVVTLKRADPVR
jgi:sugar lactone lactonase YvrE